MVHSCSRYLPALPHSTKVWNSWEIQQQQINNNQYNNNRRHYNSNRHQQKCMLKYSNVKFFCAVVVDAAAKAMFENIEMMAFKYTYSEAMRSFYKYSISGLMGTYKVHLYNMLQYYVNIRLVKHTHIYKHIIHII